MSPQDFMREEVTAGGKACNTCLSIFAQMLDAWRDGGINSFMQKLKSAGLLDERIEYVESGTRRLNS